MRKVMNMGMFSWDCGHLFAHFNEEEPEA